jgi:uncharacterized protein
MLPSLRSLIVITLAAVALARPARAQETRVPVAAATAGTIRHLLDLTGTAQLAVRGMEAMLPAQRAANPQIPAAFWDAFLSRARRDIGQLVDSMIPVYASHFTPAQLDQLVRFYESPLGRHVSEVQPLITQECMQVGQRWGAVIGREISDSVMQPAAK